MSFLCEHRKTLRAKRVYVFAPGVTLLFSLLLWPAALLPMPIQGIQALGIMQSHGVTLTHQNDSLSQADGGAVLIFPVYTSDSAAPQAQNTRISLTNTAEIVSVFVHLFFVDGVTGAAADSYLCLSANQTASLLASDADPNVNGYLVVVATDAHGCPINFNQLIGEASIKYASGHTAQLVAEAVVALAENPANCTASQPMATLHFDGRSYSALPRMLSLSNFMSRADGNETFMVLSRVGSDLTYSRASDKPMVLVFYDDAENPISAKFFRIGLQVSYPLINLGCRFPQLCPRFEDVIPSGRSGWLKVWCAEDEALLGAVFNLNAYNPPLTQGRNLHKLTLTTTASLAIPILPPNC